MKKVMILTVAIMAFSFATPQLANAMKVQNVITVAQEKVVKYLEIKVTDIPAAVSATLAKDYAGFTIEKAFLGDDGSYKIAVNKVDVKSVLFFNAKGELIKVEQPAKK
jgi:hypothetical protein